MTGDQPPVQPPLLDRSPAAVLEAATGLLLEDPALSLGELATRIGIGRTTLHRMFPTRSALVEALAWDAVGRLDGAYEQAGFEPGHGTGVPAGDLVGAVGRLVELMLPLGPQLMFLLRSAELDTDPRLHDRVTAMDAPVDASIARAQRDGVLADGLPPWWLRESLYALVYVAWEQIHRGRLAARDATAIVVRTWLAGVGAAPHP